MRIPFDARPTLGLVAALAVVMTLGCDSADPFGPPTTVVPSFEQGGFVFTATAAVLDPGARVLEVTLHVVNDTQEQRQTSILGGNCMLRPRLYDNSDGRLVWSAFDEQSACPDPEQVFDLPGGGSDMVADTFTVDVDDRSYLATVTFEHSAIGTGAALVELGAGLVSFR